MLDEPLLVNAAGHFAGAVVFGIFLALVWTGGRPRGKWLLVGAAGLAILWNIGSLAMLLWPENSADSARIVAALSFSVLSLLPAVLLHLSLQGGLRAAVVIGYLLGALAVMMHLSETLRPDLDLHQAALLAVTGGFAVLTVVSVARVLLHGGEETRGKTSRIAASMCLLLFAISFAHFGSVHPPEPWSKELVLHHAGIPLALFILLQDYRFVLLDAFARFLANVMLAALLTFAALHVVLRFTPAEHQAFRDPMLNAVVTAGSCVLLITFAFLRGYVQRWLTTVVFRRGDLEGLIRQIGAQPAVLSAESEFLPWAAAKIAGFMSVPRFELAGIPSPGAKADPELAYPALAGEIVLFRSTPAWDWVEAVVPFRLSQQDAHYLLLGRRRGGMRYLSEDLRSLSRLAALVVEELERYRSSEMQRLVSQAELRALQSQINPHFLFNALNTLYGMIPREAASARRTVQNLADIFRYFLQSEKTFIPLSEELNIVKAYLEIERLRLGPRLQTEIDVDEVVMSVPIPILSVQPLVENAIKHGLAARPDKGWLRVRAKLVNGEVVISVEDSGPGIKQSGTSAGTGVGLANVTRRLQLCYGPQADVTIRTDSTGTKAQFSVPAPRTVTAVHS